jgi:hypothetical protein
MLVSVHVHDIWMCATCKHLCVCVFCTNPGAACSANTCFGTHVHSLLTLRIHARTYASTYICKHVCMYTHTYTVHTHVYGTHVMVHTYITFIHAHTHASRRVTIFFFRRSSDTGLLLPLNSSYCLQNSSLLWRVLFRPQPSHSNRLLSFVSILWVFSTCSDMTLTTCACNQHHQSMFPQLLCGC